MYKVNYLVHYVQKYIYTAFRFKCLFAQIQNAFKCFTVQLLWPGPFRQSWPIWLQKNNITFQESWLWANQQLIKKNKLLKAQNLNIDSKRFFKNQNVALDNVFLFEILLVTPRIHLFDTSCYFVIYQQFLHYHCHTLTSSQKYNFPLHFSPLSH